VPRAARVHIPGGTYHIITRGNNKDPIFIKNEDYLVFLNIFKDRWEKYPIRIYAFVLMPNHIHFLVEIDDFPLAKLFQPVFTAYAIYFNANYKRIGHVFQDRFKSYLIEDDDYLHEVFRYIILNPIRAGICEDLDDYPWSSHPGFINQQEAWPFVDFQIFNYFGNDEEGIKAYRAYLGNWIEAEIYTRQDEDENLRLFQANYLIKQTCQKFDITYDDLLFARRKEKAILARGYFGEMAKEKFKLPLKKIADSLGINYWALNRGINKRKDLKIE